MPRIIPEARHFSMPSTELGAEVSMKRALNCWPWVRSLTQSPDAVIHSPAEIVAAWPTMVTRSRCPRALTRSTQNPVSALWKVTRSTAPAITSWSGWTMEGRTDMGQMIGHLGEERDSSAPGVEQRSDGAGDGELSTQPVLGGVPLAN
jgi:hypothetical protein